MNCIFYTISIVVVGVVLYACIDWTKELIHLLRYRRDGYDTRLAIELAATIGFAVIACCYALVITIKALLL